MEGLIVLIHFDDGIETHAVEQLGHILIPVLVLVVVVI
jgi:hypothetical protein